MVTLPRKSSKGPPADLIFVKFYKQKVRKFRLFLLKKKQRKCIDAVILVAILLEFN